MSIPQIESRPFLDLLSNIVDNRGKTCPTSASGIALIATNCIKNDNLYPVYENVRYVSDETYKNWFRGHPAPGDCIFVTKGTPGCVCLVPPKVDFCIAQDMVAIRADSKKVDPNFLFAVLRSTDIQGEIENLHVGTLIPHFKKGDFDKLLIPLPKRDLQEYIGEQYFTFSAKIDLLHRQSKTLEGMAEALWRKMFVEEADPGWRNGKLGDVIISIETGRRPKGGIDPNLLTGVPSIGAENINGIGNYDYNKTKYVTEEYYSAMKSGKTQNYDILIYKDGAYIGKKSMFANGFPFEKCCINEHVFILRTGKVNSQLFLYFILEQEELEQLNANSAQPGLNQEALISFEIVIPPNGFIDNFGEKVKTLIDKIFANSIQIRMLSRLRDTLLPKLMSGEVRVKL